MSAPTNGKPNQLVDDLDLLAGLQKNQNSLPSLFMSGKSVTAVAAVATLQSRVDAGNAFVVARGGYLQAAQANRVVIAETKEFVADLKTALLLAYKKDPAMLGQFGMVPHRKPAPKTPAAKVIAVVKGASTRAQRHTMGPRAKAKVKGTVPATVTIGVQDGVASAATSAGATALPAPVETTAPPR